MSRIAHIACLFAATSTLASACTTEADRTETAVAALQRVEERLLQPPDIDGKADTAIVVASITQQLPVTADVAMGVRGLRLVGAAPSTPVSFNQNTLLYTDTHAGASTAVSTGLAESGVIETYTVIHERSAAESYRFAIDLAPGERLESVSDTGAVVRAADGEIDTFISAPWATDAAGAKVPLSLAIDGTTLVMTAHHQSGEYAYPIVADPSIEQMRKICKGHWLWQLVCQTVVVEGGKALYKFINRSGKCVRAAAKYDVNPSTGAAIFRGYYCAQWK